MGENKFGERRDQSPPPLDVDAETIASRIAENNETIDAKARRDIVSHYRKLVEKYRNLELTLPVDDVAVKRISQELTNEGFRTTSSCEGHGRKIPNVWFQCEDQELLRELAHVLARASHFKKFRWSVRIWSGDPYLNPDSKLSFILEPESVDRILDPRTDNQELLRDLDLIGVALMEHMESIKSESENS